MTAPLTRLLPVPVLVAAALATLPPVAGQTPDAKQYLAFIRQQAADLRKGDAAPTSADAWKWRAADLRKNLLAAWGGFPETPCPLDPTSHGEPLKRDGYTVEKITFQTRPGVRMTANLYVPDAAKKAKAPAILMVHGHWKGAKQDPVVQSRCIGAAKLGFVVLCVDAFGAGERGVGTALGEYHGDMTAATLLPLGTPLSGLQVYENTRAVDYLLTRPEVDGDKIGITGASGGGNQTMYAGAWDERFKCVVPVCSVGNYQAYLGPACCMCEVVPGALKFTEEWAVLALVAPRPLMVINATQDSIQFSVAEAKKSLALTAPVFGLLGKPENLRHTIIESPHHYNQPMREAMYGWMTRHLKGEGDGGPIREPEIKTENPEDLRCYPGDTRPKDFVTIPKFAAAEAKKLLAAKPVPTTADGWKTESEQLRKVLVGRSIGVFSPLTDVNLTVIPTGHGGGQRVVFEAEAGVSLTAVVEPGKPGMPLAIVLSCEGGPKASTGELATATRRAGWDIAGLELRATGGRAVTPDKVGRAPDHNSAEWGLWIGRPLLGQWVHDVRRMLDALSPRGGKLSDEVIVIGEGPAGLVALCAAAVDSRITKAAAVGSLASYVTDMPYTDQRLGVIAPGILRDVGDVAHLAALCAPKRVVIVGGVWGNGKPLTADEQKATFAPAAHVFGILGKQDELVLTTEAATVLRSLGAVQDEPIFEPGAKLKEESAAGSGGEGPAWDPKLGVLTSGSGGIHRLDRDGKSSVYREKAGTNGLLFDREGRLVCCEPAQKRVTRIDRDGKLTVLADSFNGKKFNTPNDVTIDSKGRIYFSDPRYGPRDGMEQLDAAGKTVEGVYRIDPDGTVSRVIGREVERANGVLVSADDKFLFVADNNNDTVGGARKLWRFALLADGTVDAGSKKLLYDWGTGRGPDGVKQDAKGRLYVAGGLNKPNPPAEPATDVKGGIYVIDPESGKLLAFLGVPTDEVTNCAFGGDDRKTLYITGGGTLYSVRTVTPGKVLWPAEKK